MNYKEIFISNQTLDFYRSKLEKEEFKKSKEFSFLPQPKKEYTYNYPQKEDTDLFKNGTLDYEIMKMSFRLKQLKRAKYIIEKFNSKERKTDVKLKIDLTNGRYHLRFGRKNMRTIYELDV